MELDSSSILIVLASVVAGYIISYIKSRFEVSAIKSELREYQEHLNRQLKLTADGSKSLENELEQLKKDNENLRISVQTLGQKPGRAEVRLLNIYDSALRRMMLKAPGFSSAWEVALQEAELEYEENEKGFKSIINKVFGPSITHHAEIANQPEPRKEGFSN